MWCILDKFILCHTPFLLFLFFFYFRYKLYGNLQKTPCELLEFSLSTRSILFQFFEDFIRTHAACQQLLQHCFGFSLLTFSHLYFSLFSLHIFSHCEHPLPVHHKSANKSALYTPASSIFRKLSFTSATSSL